MRFTCPFTPAVEAIHAAIAALPTLFAAGDLFAVLFTNNPAITPGMTLAELDLLPGTAGGIGSKTVGAVPVTGFNLANGKSYMILPAPAGGFVFLSTDTVGLPATVFGVAVFSDGEGSLIGVGKLADALTFSDAGQVVAVGDLMLEFAPVPLI